MVFDLICRGCGACGQRTWDPTGAITATMCPDCDGPMSVIGIDFAGGRDQAGRSPWSAEPAVACKPALASQNAFLKAWRHGAGIDPTGVTVSAPTNAASS